MASTDNLDKKLILENSNIGVEFEFIIDSDDINAIARQMAKSIGEKVGIYTHEERISGVEPNYSIFQLTQDYSGGAFCYELVTPKLQYHKALDIIQKTFKHIKQYGYVNDRCAIHLNISFDNHKTLGISEIVNMIPLQFVCEFDEDKVYELFPERKGNVYASSIKRILPSKKDVDIYGTHFIQNYTVCSTKYYGVNFLKVPKNYIEFRYLGGKNYINKYDEIKELSEHFIISLYKNLKNVGINQEHRIHISKEMEKYHNIMPSLTTYSKFQEYFPNIKLYVDLKEDENTIQMYWKRFSEFLFRLLLNIKKPKAVINFDTETQKIQIKKAEILNIGDCKNIDIIECDVNSFLSDFTVSNKITFYNCNINESIISNAEFYNCDIKNTKIRECNSNRACVFNSCYIKNSKKYSGSFIDCYFVTEKPDEESYIENPHYINDDVVKYKEKEAKKLFKKREEILKKNKLRL